MRLIRYRHAGETAWGIEDSGSVFSIAGDMFGDFTRGPEVALVSEVTLLAPWDGGKIIGLALNYPGIDGADFKKNFEPVIFIKAANTVITEGQPIQYRPGMFDDMWIEVELVYMISRQAKDVPPEKARDHILGYTLGNDVSARNILNRDHHLARSKSMDSFCPIAPFLETDFDPSDVLLEARVNGKMVQKGRTSERFFDDVACLNLISRMFTLEPGDIIMTGTPAGAGPANESVVSPGDEVEISIEGLGILRNKVVES